MVAPPLCVGALDKENSRPDDVPHPIRRSSLGSPGPLGPLHHVNVNVVVLPRDSPPADLVPEKPVAGGRRGSGVGVLLPKLSPEAAATAVGSPCLALAEDPAGTAGAADRRASARRGIPSPDLSPVLFRSWRRRDTRSAGDSTRRRIVLDDEEEGEGEANGTATEERGRGGTEEVEVLPAQAQGELTSPPSSMETDQVGEREEDVTPMYETAGTEVGVGVDAESDGEAEEEDSDAEGEAERGDGPEPLRTPPGTGRLMGLRDSPSSEEEAGRVPRPTPGRQRRATLAVQDPVWLTAPTGVLSVQLRELATNARLPSLSAHALQVCAHRLGLPVPPRARKDDLVAVLAAWGADAVAPDALADTPGRRTPGRRTAAAPPLWGAETDAALEARLQTLAARDELRSLSVLQLKEACRRLQLCGAFKRKEDLVDRLARRLAATAPVLIGIGLDDEDEEEEGAAGHQPAWARPPSLPAADPASPAAPPGSAPPTPGVESAEPSPGRPEAEETGLAGDRQEAEAEGSDEAGGAELVLPPATMEVDSVLIVSESPFPSEAVSEATPKTAASPDVEIEVVWQRATETELVAPDVEDSAPAPTAEGSPCDVDGPEPSPQAPAAECGPPSAAETPAPVSEGHDVPAEVLTQERAAPVESQAHRCAAPEMAEAADGEEASVAFGLRLSAVAGPLADAEVTDPTGWAAPSPGPAAKRRRGRDTEGPPPTKRRATPAGRVEAPTALAEADLGALRSSLRIMAAQGLLTTLNLAALRGICKQLGIRTTGKPKAALVSLVEEAIAEGTAGNAVPPQPLPPQQPPRPDQEDGDREGEEEEATPEPPPISSSGSAEDGPTLGVPDDTARVEVVGCPPTPPPNPDGTSDALPEPPEATPAGADTVQQLDGPPSPAAEPIAAAEPPGDVPVASPEFPSPRRLWPRPSRAELTPSRCITESCPVALGAPARRPLIVHWELPAAPSPPPTPKDGDIEKPAAHPGPPPPPSAAPAAPPSPPPPGPPAPSPNPQTPTPAPAPDAATGAKRARSASPTTLFKRQRRGTAPLCRAFKMPDFSPRVEVGSGAQATVYRATFLGKGLGGRGSGLAVGTPVCLKEFTDLAAGRRELAAVEGLAPHPNVLQCFGCFETPKALYLVFELCAHDLTRVVAARPRSPAYRTPLQRRQLLKAVARGLAHLHTHDVLHCDVKLENLMVGLDGRPRICDFGLAQPFKLSPPRECVGTIFNMAPEVIDPRCSGYGEKYSTWQFGIVMAQVMWGTTDDIFNRGLEWPMRAIMDLQYRLPAVDPALPGDAAARRLLQDHILVPEDQRMTVAELLQHPFFADVAEA